MRRRLRPSIVAWMAAFLSGALGASAFAQVAGETVVTPEERARLARGELLTQPVDERRGALRLLGGTSMKVVPFPPGLVWEALSNVDEYGAMLPGDTTVRQTWVNGNERGAAVRHVYGPVRASYHARFTFQERARMIVFRLDEREQTRLRAGWGFVQLTPWGRDSTLVRFGALVDVGSGLVTGWMRPKLQEAILDAPRTLERYLIRCARRNPRVARTALRASQCTSG